jgi:hypothetical protein
MFSQPANTSSVLYLQRTPSLKYFERLYVIFSPSTYESCQSYSCIQDKEYSARLAFQYYCTGQYVNGLFADCLIGFGYKNSRGFGVAVTLSIDANFTDRLVGKN